MRENERIDMEATEAYKPLPGDLKKVGEWRRHVRKEGAIATWARILRLSSPWPSRYSLAMPKPGQVRIWQQ